MNTTRILLTAGSSLALACAAAAQVDLFSNHGPNPSTPALATGATTASGALAPAGAQWSEVQRPAVNNAGAIGGFSSHLLDGAGGYGAYRFADDFSVPAGGWTVTSVVLYAYQSGFAGPLPPFESLNLRIWSGRPGDAKSEIVFGDDTTDRLALANATDIYRVFSTTATPEPAAPDTTRRVWSAEAVIDDNGGVFLPEGTYWLDWQYVSIDPQQEIFSPPATIAGLRGAAGANARQLATGADAYWRDVVDAGKPALAPDSAQDMPFVVRGFAGPACPADWNGDGLSNSTDVSEFINDWFLDQVMGTLETDFDHNGVSNSTDVSEFINAWFVDQTTGCGG